jgi:hypothetical protein
MIAELAMLVLLAASPAAAQTEEERARALFREGEAAVERGEIARARALFDESLRVYPTTAAAFNSALTADESGAPLAALATLEALARGAYGTVPAERAAELRELRAGLEAKVGTIAFDVRGAERSQRAIDGVAVEGDEVRVMPGEHVVRVEVAGRPPQARTLAVRAGERRVAEFRFDPPPETSEPPPIGEDRDDGGGVFESPWFWAVFGVLVIAGGAVALGFAIAEDGLPNGNVFGERETLRF